VSEEYIHAHVEPTEEAIRDLQIHLEGFESIQDKYEERKNGLSLEKKKWYRNDELERAVQRFRAKLEAARAEKEQFERHEKLLESLQARLKDCKRRAKVYEARRDKLGKWLSVLKYAHTVFKRDGLPSFLNSQICPELNQAAQEYAELFTQGEIQVRFAVDEEGRMDVKIINAHGGEGVADQSEGEMKMASLITSFAVRTIAPKTNILILDEPGDGLDATSARYFARGLKSVVGKFGTILLTTHNPSILAELSDARLVTVVKERGVSRVEE
jgi:DNA repair exonuclease SbcCD ATPase subunit